MNQQGKLSLINEVFNFNEQHVLQVFEKQPGEYWFVADDICKVLEHSDTRKAVSRLDDDEKLIGTLFRSGQSRELWLINESGLYSLILSSRKENAKRFKKWVTSEVLPSIRKTGRYDKAVNTTYALGERTSQGVLRKKEFAMLLKQSDELITQLYQPKSKIEHERNYQALLRVHEVLNLDVPGLLTFPEPKDPNELYQQDFWALLHDIGNIEKLNHSIDKTLLAINLFELAQSAHLAGLRWAELETASGRNSIVSALKLDKQYVGFYRVESKKLKNRYTGKPEHIRCVVLKKQH